jgi:tyrosinase
VYLLKLEEALRSIEGCADVTMPYWDETSDDSLKNGVPWALTDEFFSRDSNVPNPLRCFRLPRNIADEIGTIDANNAANYSKPIGYETVRYPLSGLVGTDKAATEKHNGLYPTVAEQFRPAME